MKDIPEVVLRAQQVTQTLAVRPRFKHTPIEQPIQKLLCTVEGHVKVIPTRRREGCEILMTSLVFLETDLGRFFDATTYRQV